MKRFKIFIPDLDIVSFFFLKQYAVDIVHIKMIAVEDRCGKIQHSGYLKARWGCFGFCLLYLISLIQYSPI